MAAQPSRYWAHGRLMLGSPQLKPSMESVIGIVIEGVFVAMIIQRLFRWAISTFPPLAPAPCMTLCSC
jgi:hypothetical protein